MKDDDGNGPGPGPEEDDLDLGSPLSDLFDFEIETGDAFLRGVRSRINQREMAAAAVDLSLVSAGHVLWTYLEMFLETIFGSRNGTRNGTRNGKDS